MNLENVVERVEKITAPKEAAKTYNDIEMEMALSVDSEEVYEECETALKILADRFPDIENEARQVTDPPSLSRSGWSNLRRSDPDPLPPPDEDEEGPHWSVYYQPTRLVPRWVKVGAAVGALAFAGLAVTAYTAPDGCPHGSSLQEWGLESTCDTPGGRPVCTMEAFGFSPDPTDVLSGDVYASSGPSAKWCAEARPAR